MNPHRSASAGSIIKKIHEINPEMGTHEMIALVRECTRVRSEADVEFTMTEVIDEEKALRLARASVGLSLS
jgi:hypothetical protein